MERPHAKRDGADKTRRAPSAHAEALRLLARRPRSRRELCIELERKGHKSAAIDEAVTRVEASGYLNDEKLAQHFITARADRLLHGPQRLLADLERRGVSRALAERALRKAVESGDVAPLALLRRAIRRRLAGREQLDSAGYARMYNALLRAGYGGTDVRRELEPYRSAVDPFSSRLDNGMHDDFV